MSRLVEIVISVYALGLIAYAILGWMRNVRTDAARRLLGRLYDPALARIRVAVKPVQLGTTMLDVSPAILLIGLVILKGLILYLLPRGW